MLLSTNATFQFSCLDETEMAENLFAIVSDDPVAAETAAAAITAATAGSYSNENMNESSTSIRSGSMV